jgi:hypothetical protein
MIESLLTAGWFFITILLEIVPLFLVATFLAGLSLEYVSPETLRKHLGGRRSLRGMLLATGFGFVTPFCSCSTIPVLAGMMAAGIPIGVLTAFLFASPYPIEVGLIVLGPIFGWAFAIIFSATGALIAFLSGILIQALGWQNQVKQMPAPAESSESTNTEAPLMLESGFRIKVKRSILYAIGFLRKLGLYIIVGTAVGALIYGFLPEALVVEYAGSSSLFAVPIGALIGVPLYVSIIPVIPIIYSLHLKGVSAGAVIAFLITATAISPPELMMLSGLFKKKFLIAFVLIMIIGAIATGYLFNVIS